MPTYNLRVTSAQDLVALLSLSQGSQYVLQNVDRTASLWVRESVDPPAAGAGELGIHLAPNEAWVMIVAAEPMWAWSFDAGGCSLVVNG